MVVRVNADADPNRGLASSGIFMMTSFDQLRETVRYPRRLKNKVSTVVDFHAQAIGRNSRKWT
jgi:hypothetical protein